MKKSTFFSTFLVILTLIFIQIISCVNAIDFIVTYQEYNIENSVILDKQGYVQESQFTSYSSVNFNVPSPGNLEIAYPKNFLGQEFTSNFLKNKSYQGSIPVRYYNESALEIYYKSMSPAIISCNYSSNFSLIDSNYNPTLKYYMGARLSICKYFAWRITLSNGTIIMAWADFDSRQFSITLGPTTYYSGPYSLPVNSTYDNSILTFTVFSNATIKLSGSFYYVNGTLSSYHEGFTSSLASALTSQRIGKIDLYIYSWSHSIPTNKIYVYSISSSRLFYPFGGLNLYPFESNFVPNSYMQLYKKTFDNSNIKNYFNTTDYSVITAKSIKRFYHLSQSYNLINESAYYMNNANISDYHINNFENDFELRSTIFFNENPSADSYFRMNFTNDILELRRNSTGFIFRYNNLKLNLNESYTTFLVRKYTNTIQIIILSVLSQYVFTIFAPNQKLLMINANQTIMNDLNITKYSKVISILENKSLYEKNYVLDNAVDSNDWNAVVEFKIIIQFPNIQFPANKIEYDNKEFYLDSIFIDNLNAVIDSNNSINSYIIFPNFISFFSGVNTDFNKTWKYNENDFLLQNGGIITLVIVLYSNATTYTDLSYEFTAKYAILFSTNPALTYYFNLGIDILLPVMLISIFTFAMYSNSKSKWFGLIGFILGIVVLYLCNFIEIYYMIFLLILSIIAIFIILKHENTGEL